MFNHSCDPNCWWQDDFTLLARRPIVRYCGPWHAVARRCAPLRLFELLHPRGACTHSRCALLQEAGELFTYDYATEDLWDAPFQCECGTEYCRGRVTSQDYKRADLRARYGRMWKSHILELIDTVPPDPASHSMHLCAGDASQQAPSACDAGDAGACDGMAGGVTGGVPKEELRWAGSKPSIEVVHLDAQQVEASASDRCSGESDSEGSTMEARHGIIDERESDHEVRMRAESHPRRMSFGWGTDSKPEQGSAAREGAVEPVSS